MEARAQRIVETAIELAEKGGFEAVRLRDVAADAGVALGTLIPATICNLFISVPYTCRLCGLPVHRLYIAVFVPLLALTALSYGGMALTSLITDNRVITFIIDGSVVSLICGAMLLRLFKQAAGVARELDGG